MEIYFQSELNAEQILEFGFDNVCIATGSKWRADGVSRQHVIPIPTHSNMPIYTPDDLMTGKLPTGKVVVYDDDHYYMGGVLAELLANNGCEVTIVTTSAYLSEWTVNTLEQAEIHKRLAEKGVDIQLNRGIASIEENGVTTDCSFTGQTSHLDAEAVVVVASRNSNDQVYRELIHQKENWEEVGLQTARLIGDANAPGPIAWATYAGHNYARGLDEEDIGDALPFRREITELVAD